MKIYLDFVFIINFLFDFLLLFATGKLLKKILSLRRVVFGSLVGTISLSFLFINLSSLELFVLKVIISVVMILVTFGYKELFKSMAYFYLLSILLGGSLYLLDITTTYENTGFIFTKNSLSINFIVMLFISPIIILLYIKQQASYKIKEASKYQIKIYVNDDIYTLEAILDTGNNLTDPYKKRPIILIDKGINYKRKKVIYVPYKALNTTGVIPCILPDKIIINNKEFKNCLLGLSKDKFSLNGVSCILPNKFREDLC